MRADRLVALVLLLQARGRSTAIKLADELQVSVRTIHRDVQALSTAGVPVFTERGAAGGIALVEGYRTDMTGLTGGEAQALFALSQRGAPEDLGLGPALTSGLRKLLVAMPARHRLDAQRLQERILLDPLGWTSTPQDVPQLAVLQSAALADHKVRLDYPGTWRGAVVDPLGLVAKAGVWYLLADTERGRRTFRVSRCTDVTELDEPARRPADFDLTAAWAQVSGRFVPTGAYSATIRVAPDSLGLVLRTCTDRLEESAQPPTEDPDRRPIVTLRFGAEYEAMTVLLGYGDRVEVIGPPQLRAAMTATLTRLAARYADSHPLPIVGSIVGTPGPGPVVPFP